EPHVAEPGTLERLRERFRLGEPAHARRQVRVRGAARERPSEEGDRAVEPEAVEGREPAARGRDLEHGQPSAWAEDAAQLSQGGVELLDVAHAEADGGD